MHKKIFTPEQERDLIARYNAGESTVALGRAFGMGKSTVNNILRRLGVRLRTELASKRLTVEQDDELVAMLRDGVTRERASAHFGLSVNAARKLVEERGLSLQTGRPRTCEVDDAAFDVLTPEALYWAGFLFADGCVHQDAYGSPALAIALGEKDRGHLEKLRAFLKSTHTIGHAEKTRTSFGGPFAYYKVRSKQICAALTSLGIVKKRTRVPTTKLAESPAFWRGCIDGDGWLGSSTLDHGASYHPYIGLSGQMLLLETFTRFLRENFAHTPSITPTGSGVWRVQMRFDVAGDVIKSLYRDATVALDRKNVRAQAIVSDDVRAFTLYKDLEAPSRISTAEERSVLLPILAQNEDE